MRLANQPHSAGFTLHLDHIQADPFAATSRVRVTVPQTTTATPPRMRG
ncbi:MAG: hypothetical protein KGQ93_05140 [Cyanobacteria bacterium REEB459]|nr:hypothetical protein [Cyanobacteria bacterium REEB459]